jgi:ubiquinone/menaquinone biosynthesis C-methylase UbiE
MSNQFEIKSYEAHEKHIAIHGDLSRLSNQTSIDYWRHEQMYKHLTPLLNVGDKWLTIGDGMGTDANWLFAHQVDSTASDIADSVLKEAYKEGYIQKFSKENEEKISFPDNSFDYVLCKESYHHFPRPYIAVYEMLRVSSKAIILMEPVDVGIQMPAILFLKNVLDKISPTLIDKIWKNRYSFESSGNYVYKTSEREMEKIAMGIDLPFVAFKGHNDYYTTQWDLSQPQTNTKIFNKVKAKIWRKNLLSKLGLIPHQILISILFKSKPSDEVIHNIKRDGYKVIELKKNPYL